MFEGAAQNQIAKTVRDKKPFKMIDTPVLGLAGGHSQAMIAKKFNKSRP